MIRKLVPEIGNVHQIECSSILTQPTNQATRYKFLKHV